MTKRKLLVIICALIMLVRPLSVYAADYMVNGIERVYINEAYSVHRVFNSLEAPDGERVFLSQPQDIFINEQGFLFIADTGNDRIVKADAQGKVLGIFTGAEDKPLSAPKGVYADAEGNMYIADTMNARIVHLDADGVFVEEFVKPESELLGEFQSFNVEKISLSQTGYIYALMGESIMTLDANNNFRGYLGQTKLEFNLVEWLLRIFASDEQKKLIKKRLAGSYTNMYIDGNGAIYATNLDRTEGEIKKLNSIGENIYRKYIILKFKLFKPGLLYKHFNYGERYLDSSNKVQFPTFIDIAVDSNEIVTALEEKSGKLYQYDRNGNSLAVFGGKGSLVGQFSLPSSVAMSGDGIVYVLDSGMSNIQSFKPTGFISAVHSATALYADGKYEQARSLWEQVLKTDSGYIVAIAGMADAFYKQGDYARAMEYYKLADDRKGYSKAFDEYRYELFRAYFVWIVLAVAAAVAFYAFFMLLLKKRAEKTLYNLDRTTTIYVKNPEMLKKMGFFETLSMSTGILFSPAETFELIKQSRGKLNIFPAVFIFCAAYAVRVLYINICHYPLQNIDVAWTNLFLEAVKLLAPFLTWVVASYAVSSISQGESKLDEIFMATAFCLVPYIVVFAPLGLVSNVLSRGEIGFYSFVVNGTWVWVYFLVFLSFKTLNDYKFTSAFVKLGLSVSTVVLIWIVGVLIYVSTGRIYQFAAGIVRELQMLWL